MSKEIIRDYQEIADGLERIIHKYGQIEQKERCYGIDDMPLTCTEIHLIDEIGRNPRIGIKGLAKNKGVTVGAVSQMVKKMIAKDLIKKEKSQESEAKIELFLTNKGTICFEEHIRYHEQVNKKWYVVLDKLSDDDYSKILGLMSMWDKLLEEL